MALSLVLMWLIACGQAGVLTDKDTGIPMSKLGSLEFAETLVRKIAHREGFGDTLARGVNHAARSVGPGAVEQLSVLMSKAGLPNLQDARLYINTALLHATEPKPPSPQLQEITRIIYRWLEWRNREPHSYMSDEVARHIAKTFWGSETAADFSTIEGKALAAKSIQDREYAKDCLILCSFIWPIMDSEFTLDHVGDPSLEAAIFSAVCGKETSERDLSRIGEKVFNLQRAIYLRDGHRGAEDDQVPEAWYTIPVGWDMTNPELVVPGKGSQIASVDGSVVNRHEFAKMKAEYYELRGWDPVTGLQSKKKLEDLGLHEIAHDLDTGGLLKTDMDN